MSSITTFNINDLIEDYSRLAINQNFTNLNNDKIEVGGSQGTPATGTLLKGSGANWAKLALGTANQVLGVNNGGTDLEYKTLVAGTGITIVHGVASVTISASGGGGSGDVVGPASSTDNAVARFDLATGKLLQNSVVLIGDTGIMTGGDWQGTAVAIGFGGTGSATASGARTNLGLVIGTDVQAFNSNLLTIAGLTATTDNFIVSVASAWASRTPAQVRTTLGLVIGTNVQAWDADLDALAALAATAGFLGRTGAGTFAVRTLTGTANQITITNGDSTVGNPVFSLPQNIHTGATPEFTRLGLGQTADATALLSLTGQAAIQLKPFNTGAGQTSELRFLELAANGTNYTAFKSADNLAQTTTYVLPSTDPTAGQVLSASAPATGVVTLSWATAGGGTSKPNWELDILNAVNGTLTTVNNHKTLALANAIYAYVETVLPSTYAGGGLTVDIYFAIDTDTDPAHTAVWNVGIMRHQVDTDDLDVDSYAADQSSSSFAHLTSARLIRKRTVTFTNGAQMDSVAAGESFTMRIQHSGAIAGSVLLMRVQIRET